MTSIAANWDALCADPSLKDLPFKIETNRYNQILMSPASNWHGRYEIQIGALIEKLVRGGVAVAECAVQTAEGIRVPDVAWMTTKRYRPYAELTSMPEAPDICVEIISPSNAREAMMEKMRLFFESGAREVWFCDQSGKMEFFTAESAPLPVKQSKICPHFPRKLPRR